MSLLLELAAVTTWDACVRLGLQTFQITVHTKRRNKLQHDRMKDLVFVKFNSKLNQKREDKNRNPIEKIVADVLEDEDNEWITGIVPNASGEQEQQPSGVQDQVLGGSLSQGAAATSQPKRKRGTQQQQRGNRKRKKIPAMDEELHTSSSESENDNDLSPSPAGSCSDDDDKLSDSLYLSD
ncbi:hypothetical protein C2845_PM17G07590 [Panicum miliaceum]|uniref:HAT C-terminal dimerisation domain-containing protein n=1 Tax=Panicum miliaceum TaxID=4540 RepID=A0A3L6Q1Z5_PANMI|nr:hypothetical protein C2845_PM17G07590 [Panicum miliaceum]